MTIQNIKRKIVPILKRRDVSKAAIFGSAARGELKKRSDIDILIQFKKTKGLFDLIKLESELEKKLVRYVPDVNLSVVVAQVNSMMVYVVGRVNKPGRFALNTNINVLQALAMAGGLNPFAKRNNIKIFREVINGTHIFPFYYDDVTQGKNVQLNIRLRRGDVVVVP